jgi:hypothetical protein
VRAPDREREAMSPREVRQSERTEGKEKTGSGTRERERERAQSFRGRRGKRGRRERVSERVSGVRN